MTPNEAGGTLAKLAREYQRQHPSALLTFERALDAVRGTDEGGRLFALWGGRTAAAQVKSFGQTARQQSAIEAKESASHEIDIRARRLMQGGGGKSYAEAVAEILADDRDLRRRYESA